MTSYDGGGLSASSSAANAQVLAPTMMGFAGLQSSKQPDQIELKEWLERSRAVSAAEMFKFTEPMVMRPDYFAEIDKMVDETPAIGTSIQMLVHQLVADPVVISGHGPVFPDDPTLNDKFVHDAPRIFNNFADQVETQLLKYGVVTIGVKPDRTYGAVPTTLDPHMIVYVVRVNASGGEEITAILRSEENMKALRQLAPRSINTLAGTLPFKFATGEPPTPSLGCDAFTSSLSDRSSVPLESQIIIGSKKTLSAALAQTTKEEKEFAEYARAIMPEGFSLAKPTVQTYVDHESASTLTKGTFTSRVSRCASTAALSKRIVAAYVRATENREGATYFVSNDGKHSDARNALTTAASIASTLSNCPAAPASASSSSSSAAAAGTSAAAGGASRGMIAGFGNAQALTEAVAHAQMRIFLKERVGLNDRQIADYFGGGGPGDGGGGGPQPLGDKSAQLLKLPDGATVLHKLHPRPDPVDINEYIRLLRDEICARMLMPTSLFSDTSLDKSHKLRNGTPDDAVRELQKATARRRTQQLSLILQDAFRMCYGAQIAMNLLRKGTSSTAAAVTAKQAQEYANRHTSVEIAFHSVYEKSDLEQAYHNGWMEYGKFRVQYATKTGITISDMSPTQLSIPECSPAYVPPKPPPAGGNAKKGNKNKRKTTASAAYTDDSEDGYHSEPVAPPPVGKTDAPAIEEGSDSNTEDEEEKADEQDDAESQRQPGRAKVRKVVVPGAEEGEPPKVVRQRDLPVASRTRSRTKTK